MARCYRREVSVATDANDQLLAGLNPSQREAVTLPDGPALVIAGAGSGKTRVLTSASRYLLASAARARTRSWRSRSPTGRRRDARARRAARSAAVARACGSMTFHAACGRILRREADRLGYRSNFTIYDQADQVRCRQGVPRGRSAAIRSASRRAASTRASPREKNRARRGRAVPRAHRQLLRPGRGRRLRAVRAAPARVQRAWTSTTCWCSTRRPAARARRRARSAGRRAFNHVLVDEYQDTNHAQYRIVRAALRRAPQRVRRRRRRPVDLHLARRRHPQHPRLRARLPGRARRRAWSRTTARRSASSMPRTPSSSTTRGRSEKRLWTRARRRRAGPRDRGRRRARRGADRRRADRRCSSRAARAPREIAVFYRTNAQSRVLEELLVRHGVPYQVDRRPALLRARRDQGRAGVPAACSTTRPTRSRCAASSTSRARGIGDAQRRPHGRRPPARERLALGRARRSDGAGVRDRGARAAVRGVPRPAWTSCATAPSSSRWATLLETLLDAHRHRRRARGRAHDRGVGPHREPPGARRRRARVHGAQRGARRSPASCRRSRCRRTPTRSRRRTTAVA